MSKKIDEAEVTIYKKGKDYEDLTQSSLVYKGVNRLTDKQMNEILGKNRLRFTLVTQCNLWCVFCSNEGSSYEEKLTNKNLPIEDVISISEALIKNTKLNKIDFSGGEPLTHPDFLKKEYRLLKWTKSHPDVHFSIHTNGILLKKEVVDQLENFSRIGISVHSLEFDKWNQITNAGMQFSLNAQKIKFDQLLKNLEYLKSKNIGNKVFLKSVVMRGINDSSEDLRKFLDACQYYGFHPKFLQFEPQYKEQEKFVIGRKDLFNRLKNLGCKFEDNAPFHNDKKTYIPSVNFTYKDAPMGLHSIFGCGEEGACKSCYKFLCMFVKPYTGKAGCYIKPCSVLDTRFDLTHALQTKNQKEVYEIFKISREYLMLAPGLGCNEWNKEEEYRGMSCS